VINPASEKGVAKGCIEDTEPKSAHWDEEL
jgi:hypothetical protein